jgi:spectinomycin phosphotransferase
MLSAVAVSRFMAARRLFRRQVMRRDDPGVDTSRIVAALAAQYGVSVASIEFLPIGYDLGAAVYEVVSSDGTVFFLKVRFGPIAEAALLVARALADRGIPHVLAPLPTRSAALSAPLDDEDGSCLILYPFVRGTSAMEVGMSDEQWRTFGATLRVIHDSGLEAAFRSRLRVEDFALPSAALVRRLLTLVRDADFASPAATRFAAFWGDNTARIGGILDRAEELGGALQARSLPLVLCHGDIHAANILVGADARIHLVDWDGPLIAPRERDLLFIIGSTIARRVEPWEEDLFIAGYGHTVVDPTALVYYRYERIIEDLGEIGKSVFLETARSEEMRAAEAELAMSFFAPEAEIDRAEVVTPRWMSDASTSMRS